MVRCLVLALALLSGCATATRILSDPPGALVYVNGELVGRTPVVYHNDKGLPRRYHLELRRPGCDALDLFVDTRMSYLWGITGLIVPVTYLWAWSLDSEYDFFLDGPEKTCTFDEEEYIEELDERYGGYDDDDYVPPPRKKRR
jgi:hypothetical protein